MSQPQRTRRRTKFLVFGAPMLEQAAIDEVVDSLRSGWIGTGPKVARFETALADYVSVPRVSCVSSCTAALILGLRALGVGRGDEVILPAMTFVASANAIEHAGARPVLVDCDERTGLLDLDAAAAAVSAKTAAIMPVHFAGRPVDMDRLNELRDTKHIAVIEDAAHAIGAEWNGRRIGAFGNLTAYSFYVTKNITTIEGGALAAHNGDVSDRIERLALHGLSVGAWQRYSDEGFKHYEVEEPGFKYNMTDVQAAVGLTQLPRLDEWIEARSRLWDLYNTLLGDLPLILPQDPEPRTRHARHLYQVRVREDCQLSRDALLGQLTDRLIGTGVHYRGVHLHPYYRQRYALRPEDLPASTAISNTTLSLPLGPNVTDEDAEDVVWALQDAFGHAV